MAFLDEVFDLDKMDFGDDNFEPLPEGWYEATITGATVKPTKAGTGHYINMSFEINGPTHAGRLVFTNLNYKNPNPKAEEIGRQQVAKIMMASGLKKLSDTDQFIGHSLRIKLSIRRSEEWGDSNEVKAFKALNPTDMSVGVIADKAKSNGKKSSSGSAPWEK